ncbi:MAG: DJ-1 family glyoxalase III [Sedimentisphaeraceae bacterium JB056]
MSKQVLVPISDGVEELEAITIIDVLRRAGAEVTVASTNEDLAVVASRGVKLVADAPISVCVCNKYDLVVLPGGMPGAEHLRDCPEVAEILKRQRCHGKYYAAICASPAVVLAHHGLLPGKATCYPAMQEMLGDSAVDQTVVIDGLCVTSQGPGTAMEFALVLTELLFGEEKRTEIAQGMLVK